MHPRPLPSAFSLSRVGMYVEVVTKAGLTVYVLPLEIQLSRGG